MKPPLRIRIVGGSLAGLFTGVLLHQQGLDVRIYERSGANLSGRGAGLSGGGDLVTALRMICGDELSRLSVTSKGQVAFERDGQIAGRNTMPGTRFSWDVLFHAARSKLPDDLYVQSQRVVTVEDGPDGASLFLDDGSEERADLVIGSDGVSSITRRTVNPEQHRNLYAGYTAWRIFIPEAELPDELTPYTEDLVSFTQHGVQAIGYMTPGENAEIEKGRRRYSWGWYRRAPVEELAELYTDAQGRHFDYSLPPGGLSASRFKRFQEDAAAILPPQFVALTQSGARPWIQGIYDYIPERLAGQLVVLVGDAGALARPHVGAGTSKAAGDAISIARALGRAGSIDEALALYTRSRLVTARYLVERSRDIGVALGLQSSLELKAAMRAAA